MDVWGGGGLLGCVVDHILQEFNTLFLTRFRTYKTATPPQTKTPVKTKFRVGVFIVPSSMGLRHLWISRRFGLDNWLTSGRLDRRPTAWAEPAAPDAPATHHQSSRCNTGERPKRSVCGFEFKLLLNSRTYNPKCLSQVPDLGSRIWIFFHSGSWVQIFFHPESWIRMQGQKKHWTPDPGSPTLSTVASLENRPILYLQCTAMFVNRYLYIDTCYQQKYVTAVPKVRAWVLRSRIRGENFLLEADPC